MSTAESSYKKKDVEHYVHPYTNLSLHLEKGPMILSHGKGIYVYDDKGKEYIEGLAGLWCTSLGFGEEELVEAATAQMRKLPFYHTFAHKATNPSIDLAAKLKEIAPVPVSKVFFANSGSEANDSVIKLVWYYNNALGRPKKKKIISRMKAYHGVTIAAASLTGLPHTHQDFDLPIPNILHTDCPHYYRFARDGESEEEFASRLAGNLEKMIVDEGPETIAAFIAEPVMGAGGVIVPPATYFEKIQDVLKRYDVLMLADEVICGFGRTGNMFGCETFGIKPDTITVAKALSSAYLPISAVLLSQDIFDAMVRESEKLGTFGHGFTYSGHPVPAAVACRTIELMAERDILGHVRRIAPHFQRRLKDFGDHPLVGEVRGVGLMGALELVADKATKRPFDSAHKVGAYCVSRAEEHGLIVRAMGDSVAFCPPLIITESQIDDMFDIFSRALGETEAWVRSNSLRKS
ncbi:MAG: aspartate aminotransferase family protein [Spirochaetales bacterium]|nr:aspartate aminotransferase family protein [Spirochaetales bacterium]